MKHVAGRQAPRQSVGSKERLPLPTGKTENCGPNSRRERLVQELSLEWQQVHEHEHPLHSQLPLRDSPQNASLKAGHPTGLAAHVRPAGRDDAVHEQATAAVVLAYPLVCTLSVGLPLKRRDQLPRPIFDSPLNVVSHLVSLN